MDRVGKSVIKTRNDVIHWITNWTDVCMKVLYEEELMMSAEEESRFRGGESD